MSDLKKKSVLKLLDGTV